MKIALLSIGTEVVQGNIIDSNSAYIARRMGELGFDVVEQRSVVDDKNAILKAFTQLFEVSSMVITTGGLGPTPDDLSKETAAEFLNKKLELNEFCFKAIEKFFLRLGRKMNAGNRKQALFPADAYILKNPIGTAPGCVMESENDKIIALLPGPPREMKRMFEERLLPYLEKFSDKVCISKDLKTFGLGEGHLAEQIEELIGYSDSVSIAPYAIEGETLVRITVRSDSKADAVREMQIAENKIRAKLEPYIYGEGNTSLEEELARILIEHNLKIAIAESCTGGLLSGRLVNYPGISETFLEGFITYSNASKEKNLFVSPELLKKHGAVSEEVARSMVEGLIKQSKADVGISVTGIAGPGGGNEEKPVGTVYIGLSINQKTQVKKLQLGGRRDLNRNWTVLHALNWLRKELLAL